MQRRQFIQASIAAGASPSLVLAREAGWSAGQVSHLVPAANHDRFVIKAGFHRSVVPSLLVADKRIPGRPTDTTDTGFAFDVQGLTPDTIYELSLVQGRENLCDPWPLKTFPAPDAEPEHVRLLVFTCAGGHPLMTEGENSIFLPMDIRRRLLNRGLAFQPDALIAIGDHIYWDQRTLLESSNPQRRELAAEMYNSVGMLDRAKPALGSPNEALLKVVAGEQIVPLYGTTLRSTPSYFINDDHDYFENDEATERFVTLPPHHYQKSFFRFMRDHYFPEFLPDPGRWQALPGDLGSGLNESFGALRWGRLGEILMYDCAGHLSLKGAVAGLVPLEVERWLAERTGQDAVRQLIHVPSHPFGWTAGKWREWYPDVADTGNDDSTVARMNVEGEQFTLTTDRPKFMWQSGWWLQHQRLLNSLSEQRSRVPVVLSGDLHATGHAQIVQSGDLDFSKNPVNTLITGTLGTGNVWPSQARGTPPVVASHLQLESPAPVTERNGFTLVDLTPDAVRVRLFAWRRELASSEAIDSLEPYHDMTLRR